MRKLLFPLFAALLLFSACSDDNPDNSSAKDFIFRRLKSAEQKHSINASTGGTVTLTGGMKFDIPANAFTKGGAAVTGQIDLYFFEVVPGKPSGSLMTGTNTNYFGSDFGSDYFVTDGYFYINAVQGSSSLDRKLSERITVSVPTSKSNGTTTRLWRGVSDGGPDENQFSWVDWTEDLYPYVRAGSRVVVDMAENEAIATDGKFTFDFGEIGWWNCDVFWWEAENAASWTTLSVTLTGVMGQIASYQGYSGDTFVFFYPKGSDIIAQLYTDDYGEDGGGDDGGPVDAARANISPVDAGGAGSKVVKSYDDSIPVGTVGRLIAFSIQQGKYSLATKDITVTADMNVDLELVSCSESAITAAIAALDSYK